ncbi:MAG TPA: phosphodiester glycosidase family protein [Actinocatenispora sp.]
MRLQRLTVVLGVTSVLAFGLAAPGFGAPDAAPHASTAAPTSIEINRTTRPVAPGVTLSSFDRYETGGWLRAQSLSVDLSGGNGVDYLSADPVANDQPISTQVKARPRAVAAINGDFFDINDTGAPEGVGVSDGNLVKSPNDGTNNAVSIDPAGAGRILQMYFDGTVTLPSGTRKLAQYNGTRVGKDGIGEYTTAWGTMSRARPVQGATDTAEVTVHDGHVSVAAGTPAGGAIAKGDYVLVGREAGAAALRGLAVGDAVSVAYAPRTSDGSRVRTAIGANQLLVVDGAVQTPADDGLAARSAVGFSKDGSRMYLLTVDGKQTDSVGITVPEMARMMAEMGAYNAVNIDGGGSSTLLARQPGTDTLAMENSPSDGSERPVANGLAVTAPAGSGKLRGFWVATKADAESAPTVDARPGGHPDRVFPGLTRGLSATGYDETYGPAAGTPSWLTSDGRVGTVDRAGVFHARGTGTVTVTAHRGTARGRTTLTVLGQLQRIGVDTARVGLSNGDATGHFGIVGYDASGFTAPIEPSDVSLDYDRSLLSVGTDANGNFTVKARKDSGATLVTVHVGRYETQVPVTVGLTDQAVATFDDAAQWTFTAARATGSATAGDGHTGTGLALSYDFTQSTATRAAYASPPKPITVPGQPQAFGMWLYGNGHGEWPTLDFVDAAGTHQLLRGDYMTWTGWKYVEMAVPAGVSYPLTLSRFYVAETRADTKYQGALVLDDLVAKVPPTVDAPAAPTVRDPVVISNGTLAGRNWRFAVMSDAQFVARDPDSDIVASARRTLREIRAAKPDFLIIDGDLVDEGSAADLTFAHQILTEELGDAVPWYYVPGNHEVMGGSIATFTAEFGAAQRVFDHKGTRFVTLDTSSLTLRGGGLDQIALLRRTLDGAAKDRSVNSVMLVEHVPPRDPTPQQGSQLGDRKEAELVESWLADFGRKTGKGVGFVSGHVGVFHASHVDGVPYVVNGNSGKNPAAPADQGGFVGWTEFGVNPVSAHEQADRRAHPYGAPSDWLAARIRPQTDTVTITAPATLSVGTRGTATATLTQQGRDVPVAYPVSADWSGSSGVAFGGGGHGAVVRFDPVSRTLTALRRGTATLVVDVNGVRQRATVTVR